MAWDELKRLQLERRRLEAVAAEMNPRAVLPGSPLHAVLQEHRRRLDERYARALKAAAGEPDGR